jgi:hypothetical protein
MIQASSSNFRGQDHGIIPGEQQLGRSEDVAEYHFKARPHIWAPGSEEGGPPPGRRSQRGGPSRGQQRNLEGAHTLWCEFHHHRGQWQLRGKCCHWNEGPQTPTQAQVPKEHD